MQRILNIFGISAGLWKVLYQNDWHNQPLPASVQAQDAEAHGGRTASFSRSRIFAFSDQERLVDCFTGMPLDLPAK